VIKEFGGTKQANLAKFYAGISYFRLGNFNKSIEYLKDFSTNAKQVQTIAYGTIGDAYAELKNNDEAFNYYQKAGTHFPEDEGLSAEYLYRAAQILEVTGKNDDAIAIYKDIKVKYPKTEKGITADKFIYRLKIQP
jgi:TolA-binding protein